MRQLVIILFLFSLLSGCKSDKGKGGDTGKDSVIVNQDSLDAVNKAKKEEAELGKVDRYINDISRLMAGLEPLEGSTTAKWDTLPAAKAHRQRFDLTWKAKRANQLDKLEKFCEENMKEWHNTDQNVFYPFSGADAITINSIYPNAKNYILFGLEIEGSVPELDKSDNNRFKMALDNLHRTMDDLMGVSFFMTKDMAGDLIRTDFKGISPVLMAFLSRMGHEILTVDKVKVDSTGAIVTYTENIKQTPWEEANNPISGVRIKYRKSKDAPIQTMNYFCLNIDNNSMKKNPQFFKAIDNLGPTRTYIKAASYLMHGGDFTSIKNKVLDVSDLILEDDSGIPYQFFADQFDVTLYGRYNGPIPLFKSRYQKDYFDAYQKDKENIKVLDFGIGYVYTKGASNLLKAEKRKEGSKKKSEPKKSEEKK